VTILDLKVKTMFGESDEPLKNKINSLIQQGKKQLLLNFEDVVSIESSCLEDILSLYSTVRRQGGTLKLINIEHLLPKFWPFHRP
jgi:anti-anti-sigma regulatory factor